MCAIHLPEAKRPLSLSLLPEDSCLPLLSILKPPPFFPLLSPLLHLLGREDAIYGLIGLRPQVAATPSLCSRLSDSIRRNRKYNLFVLSCRSTAWRGPLHLFPLHILTFPCISSRPLEPFALLRHTLKFCPGWICIYTLDALPCCSSFRLISRYFF